MSSDCEDDSQPIGTRKHLRTSGRKRSYVEDSESESSDSVDYSNTTPKNPDKFIIKKGTRSSERIQKKQSKVFSMPKKQDVWKNIETTPSPAKVLDQLKPRKIVNNFTRVTHRYNYDPFYTDDEDSSLGGFIASDEDVNEDSVNDGVDNSDSQEDDEKKDENTDDESSESNRDHPSKSKSPKKSVIGFRKRIQLKGESSSDTSDEEWDNKHEKIDDIANIDDSGINVSSSRSVTCQRKRSKSVNVIESDENSSDSCIVTSKRTRNKSLMESDDESKDGDSSAVSMDLGAKIEGEGHNSDFSSDETLERLPVDKIIEQLTSKNQNNYSSVDEKFTSIKHNQKSAKESHQPSCSFADKSRCATNDTCVILVANSGNELNSSENLSDNRSSTLFDTVSNIKTEPEHNSVGKICEDVKNDSVSNKAVKVSPTKKTKGMVIVSTDSETEDESSKTKNKCSESELENGSSNSESEDGSSESKTEDEASSIEATSRAQLQQKKQNFERQKKFQQFKEARKKYTSSKSPKGKC